MRLRDGSEVVDLSPRSAGLLFARALRQVDRIQPPSLREPIATMLEAGVEQCTIWSSLLGKPVNHLIALAEALTVDDDARSEPAGEAS